MRHLSLFTLTALLTIWAGLAFATGYNRVTNNYYTENTTVNNSTVESDRAASVAISQCHFDMSTHSNQGCLGVGYDANTSNNAVALGFGKRLGDNKLLLNGSVVLDNDEKPAYGVGLNFHF